MKDETTKTPPRSLKNRRGGVFGVTKIDVGTDGRLVWRPIRREFFRDQPVEFDLRKPSAIFMPAYADDVVHKNQAFGGAGQLEAVRKVIAK